MAGAAVKHRELEETSRKLDGLSEALADSFRAPGLQAKLDELEKSKARLQWRVSTFAQTGGSLSHILHS